MDLLLAGWSIRDVGGRLSWWELRTFIKKLKPDSYLWSHIKPENVLRYKLSQVEVQFLGEVHDRVLELPFIQAGQYDKAPDGLIRRILDNDSAVEREKSKKRLSPGEIRAAVAASMQ